MIGSTSRPSGTFPPALLDVRHLSRRAEVLGNAGLLPRGAAHRALHVVPVLVLRRPALVQDHAVGVLEGAGDRVRRLCVVRAGALHVLRHALLEAVEVLAAAVEQYRAVADATASVAVESARL